MLLKVDPEFHKLIPPLLTEEFKQLESNILQEGCNEPLTLWNGVLIDGHNRYKICTKHGIKFKTVSKKFSDREAVKLWIGEHQLGRRNLSEDQRAVLANDVRELRAKAAIVERSKQIRAAGKSDVSVKSADTSKKKDSRAAVAKEAGLPEGKVRKAQEIKKVAPEVLTMVRAGTVSLVEGKKLAAMEPEARKSAVADVKSGEDVRTAIRSAKKKEYNEAVRSARPKPLAGTYRILYADPPWKYVGLNGMDEHGHAERHYDCLDDEQLKVFKPDGKRLVRDIVDKNSVMFMWVTSPLLERCFPIARAWGFEYKSSFVWDKIKHNMGHYNSVRHEFLLIFVRGACKPDVAKLIDSVQSIERTKHSAKPEEFYGIIEGLYDHGRKLELFSRSSRRGWDAVGNQAT